MYTIYRRDYWRSIRKRPAPALTVDHLRLSPLISKISVLTVTFVPSKVTKSFFGKI